jgi:hypothetical protein
MDANKLQLQLQLKASTVHKQAMEKRMEKHLSLADTT